MLAPGFSAAHIHTSLQITPVVRYPRSLQRSRGPTKIHSHLMLRQRELPQQLQLATQPHPPWSPVEAPRSLPWRSTGALGVVPLRVGLLPSPAPRDPSPMSSTDLTIETPRGGTSRGAEALARRSHQAQQCKCKCTTKTYVIGPLKHYKRINTQSNTATDRSRAREPGAASNHHRSKYSHSHSPPLCV